MMRQIGYEFFKLSRRGRSYIGYAAFLAINIMMMLAAKYGGLSNQISSQAAGGPLQMSGNILNAEFMAWFVIGSPIAGGILVFWLPLFTTLILGDIFAGENSEGTIRALLARPVTRGSVFWAKIVASVAYAAALVGFMVASAYALGAAFFGTGGLLTANLMGQVAWYGHTEALSRLLLAWGLTVVVATTIGVIAIFISIWVNNSLAAVGGAIMMLFATAIMSAIPWFRPLKPYLFGSHVDVGQKAFAEPIPWHDIGLSLLCLGAWMAVLLAASLLIFRRKDVLA